MCTFCTLLLIIHHENKQKCFTEKETLVAIRGQSRNKEIVALKLKTDLLVGVVTLARMVKLLLTVRRLANTCVKEAERKRENSRISLNSNSASHDKQLALIIYCLPDTTEAYLSKRGDYEIFSMTGKRGKSSSSKSEEKKKLYILVMFINGLL